MLHREACGKHLEKVGEGQSLSLETDFKELERRANRLQGGERGKEATEVRGRIVDRSSKEVVKGRNCDLEAQGLFLLLFLFFVNRLRN